MRGSHGFGETEDAARMIARVQEIKPLVNVVALEETVGGERAAAEAVSASVGEEHAEAVGEEELSVSGHADAVVAEAVEENYGVSVFVMRIHFPGAESCAVGSCDGDVVEICFGRLSGLAKFGGVTFGEWASGWVESGVGQVDSAYGAED